MHEEWGDNIIFIEFSENGPIEEIAGTAAIKVSKTIRVLLVGPLAQFGRSGIVNDLVSRITEAFARNLEARLSGASDDQIVQAPLGAGALVWQVFVARLKRLFGKGPARP